MDRRDERPDKTPPLVSMFRQAEAAILKKDIETIDALIGSGFDVHARTDVDRWNLLHIALVSVVEPPEPDVVRHLIQLGIDVNARDRRLWTPMHFAVRTKSADVVRLLVEAGAEIDPVNDEHMTPLHLSVIKANRNIEITGILLAAGADPNADRGAGSVRHYLGVASSPDIGPFRELINRYPEKSRLG